MDTSLITGLLGGSGGALALVGGYFKFCNTRVQQFEKRHDERLLALEEEVKACHQRDASFLVITMAVKMMVPELLRIDPVNPVLNHLCSALSALPADNIEFEHLLAELEKIRGADQYWASRKRGKTSAAD